MNHHAIYVVDASKIVIFSASALPMKSSFSAQLKLKLEEEFFTYEIDVCEDKRSSEN